MHRRSIITNTSIEGHFHEAITAALETQRVAASGETVAYLVHLLASHLRSERLFDDSPDGRTIAALAELYGEAALAGDGEQRAAALRRLGDLALLVAGVFSASLSRKLVDVDYYIAMGGNAYGCLAGDPTAAVRARALRAVYAELAEKFRDFVDVLGEASEHEAVGDGDALRWYELWLRTGSRRAGRKLRALGIVVNPAGASLTTQ